MSKAVLQIMRDLRAYGIGVERHGSNLRLYPATAVTEEIVSDLKAVKDEILEILIESEAADRAFANVPDGEPAPAAEVRQWLDETNGTESFIKWRQRQGLQK